MSKTCCDNNFSKNNNQDILINHPSLKDEVFCHFPYAVFSVALSMVILSFLAYPKAENVSEIAYRLFHNFHFLHLLFSASGTVLMFKRYSTNFLGGIFIGFTAPTVFCTLSDSFLPFLGGKMFGLSMIMHWCFFNHFGMVFPFLIGGIINGWIMSMHDHSKQMFYSLGFHFCHIFVSSMASLLYLVSFGFVGWWKKMGFVFLYLIFAVLVPCIMSDVVVPMIFARLKFNKK